MLRTFSLITITVLSCCTICLAQSTRKPPVLRGTNTSADTPSAQTSTTNAPRPEANDDRVATTLVTVPAIVMDRNGRYIGNLRKEDFRLYQDGVEQNVVYFASVEKPFTVALVLDVSGSTQSQLSQIRDAANTFVSGRLCLRPSLVQGLSGAGAVSRFVSHPNDSAPKT